MASHTLAYVQSSSSRLKVCPLHQLIHRQLTAFFFQGIMIHRISSMYGHDRKIIYLLCGSFALEIMLEIIVQFYSTDVGSQCRPFFTLRRYDLIKPDFFLATMVPAASAPVFLPFSGDHFGWSGFLPSYLKALFLCSLCIWESSTIVKVRL